MLLATAETSTHRAKLRHTTAGNTPPGVIEYDVSDYDVGGLADLANNAIVVQRTGFYRAESQFHVTAGSANRQLRIKRNNVDIAFDIASGGSQGDSVHAVYEGELQSGDVITAEHGVTTNQFVGGALGPWLSVREL